jgi:hypothetical protein
MYDDLEKKEIEYARGKTAGNAVNDSSGNPIITSGQIITDDIIEKARASGELHYLMVAAVSGALAPGSSDLGRRIQEFRDVTEDHEVEFVRGRAVGRDVCDFQGNIIIRKGETVDENHIRHAERQGALQDIVLAVGAAGLSLDAEAEEEEENISETIGITPDSY